ncbi:hypothetical protein F5144DRAFT_599309 [Chaetomium tenue]|uniref:Uncharacterized protein n=1 Tax=Chaetomium tenue TaxID=1854479 RepID=A0ACB7PFA5_9PEZI|nr:hypothetical protein F5144DRAFT_599309 [Chaetomium globosum]
MSLLYLETHNPNRPPPQIPYKRTRRSNKLSTWVANTDLPPHRILRLTHLARLTPVLDHRRERLRAARAQTEQAIEQLTTPIPPRKTTTFPRTTTFRTTKPIPPKPRHPLHRQWQLEQHLPTPLAQQAHTMSHTLAAAGPPPRYASPRERQIHADPSQRTILCYLRLRARRQRYIAREGRWLAQSGSWLLERAGHRAKGWIKARDEKHSARRVMGRKVKWYEGWRVGVRYDWELDAWRWGVGLRRGTVMGRVGKEKKKGREGWPGQEMFEIYKLVRYGWTEVFGMGEDEEAREGREAEMLIERGGFKQAYGSGMMLKGSSPLRQAWTPVVEEV